MVNGVGRSVFRLYSKRIHCTSTFHQSMRWQSTSSGHATHDQYQIIRAEPTRSTAKAGSPLSRLPLSNLLRTLLLSSFFSSPIIFKLGLSFMRKVANSKTVVLDPDKNILLKAILKPLIYDQFCAGTNHTQVQSTVAGIKGLGFSGVILCYGKEVQVDKDAKFLGHVGQEMEKEIEQWKDGNLQTLAMIGEGDWLGMKFTGAGNKVTEALLRGEVAPVSFLSAMDGICQTAAARGCRIWVDSEQQAVQSTIDRWTVDLMRKWNKNRKPLIYNTVQAYLKASRDKLAYQLQLAQEEGWSLGVKLVRGAYISNDTRSLIHDTKADTDASYNGIVRDLLQGSFPGFGDGKFARLELFLAGHNRESILKATSLARELSHKGQLKVNPEFGQLQGMADDIACEILEFGDEAKNRNEKLNCSVEIHVPQVYKCLTWGSVQECMQYLVRRAVENQGAAERIKDGTSGYAQEVRRRFKNALWKRTASNPHA